MTTRVLTTSKWKFTTQAAALAGLATLLFLQAAAPATAKPMSRCQVRHSLCSETCVVWNIDGGGIQLLHHPNLQSPEPRLRP